MTAAPGLAPATVASARTGRTLRIDSARGGPAPQVVIDHLMDVRGGDLGAGDRVLVIRPAYGVYLPDTAATVTVWGGSVCRTSDRCRGGFEVRAGARLVARGAARVRVRSGGAADIYDDAAVELHEGACGYAYGGRVRTHRGATVYAWAGSRVRADEGARVWIMGVGVALDADPRALVGNGADSPLAARTGLLVKGDVLASTPRRGPTTPSPSTGTCEERLQPQGSAALPRRLSMMGPARGLSPPEHGQVPQARRRPATRQPAA